MKTQSKDIGRFRVTVTQYVPEQDSPWFCKVFRIADGAEFSLQKNSYGTADEAMAVGETWARETIALNPTQQPEE